MNWPLPDAYEMKARYAPALVAVVPFLLFFVSPDNLLALKMEQLFAFFFPMLSLIVVSFIVRSRGQQAQKRLYTSWGGAPSTICLRPGDNTTDRYTKHRYRLKLQGRIPDLAPWPDEDQERRNPTDADSFYSSVTAWLRENTRDVPLVQKELANYGFARNLYGIRFFCLLISGGLAITSLIIGLMDFQIKETVPVENFWRLGLLTFYFGVVYFFFSAERVKGAGFDYAKALFAATDKL